MPSHQVLDWFAEGVSSQGPEDRPCSAHTGIRIPPICEVPLQQFERELLVRCGLSWFHFALLLRPSADTVRGRVRFGRSRANGGAGSLERTRLWGRGGDFPVKQGKNREFS